MFLCFKICNNFVICDCLVFCYFLLLLCMQHISFSFQAFLSCKYFSYCYYHYLVNMICLLISIVCDTNKWQLIKSLNSSFIYCVHNRYVNSVSGSGRILDDAKNGDALHI